MVMLLFVDLCWVYGKCSIPSAIVVVVVVVYFILSRLYI